jgi:hypothetical protein
MIIRHRLRCRRMPDQVQAGSLIGTVSDSLSYTECHLWYSTADWKKLKISIRGSSCNRSCMPSLEVDCHKIMHSSCRRFASKADSQTANETDTHWFLEYIHYFDIHLARCESRLPWNVYCTARWYQGLWKLPRLTRRNYHEVDFQLGQTWASFQDPPSCQQWHLQCQLIRGWIFKLT